MSCCKKDEIIYISTWYRITGGDYPTYFYLYKIENGNATIISNVSYKDLSLTTIYSDFGFFINDDLFLSGIVGSSSIKLFKSSDLGKKWTDITKQLNIVGNGKFSISNLHDLKPILKMNEKIHMFFYPDEQYVFDGNSIKKETFNITEIKLSTSDALNVDRYDGNNYTLKHIVQRKELSDKEYEYTLYKCEEKDGGLNFERLDSYIYTERVSNSLVLKINPFSFYYKYKDLDAREVPLRAYVIEDREKG